MIHIKFQVSKPSGLKKTFLIFLIYFYGLKLGPLARGHLGLCDRQRHLGLWDLHLNICGRGQIGNATYQTSYIWSGGAMALGKLPVPGRPAILITVGQGPIALAVGAGGGGLDIFTLNYPFSSFSLSLGDGPI